MNTNAKNAPAKGTAVITGASAGIGRMYADRLAGRGYDLLLAARRADLLDEVAVSLRKRYGVKITTVVVDLRNPTRLEEFAALIAADATVTMLVNNVGTATMGPIDKITSDGVEAMTDLNIIALAQLTFAVLPGFKARDHGTIINIGSILGFHWLPVSTVYSATKAYVLNFTRGLQDELAGSRIVVQLVLPSATATDLWDISGVPLSALPPKIVMSVEHLVDAALVGLDLGEKVTLPSVENAAALLAALDTARKELLSASQTGEVASRYRLSTPTGS
jgi:uncharacterized protein